MVRSSPPRRTKIQQSSAIASMPAVLAGRCGRTDESRYCLGYAFRAMDSMAGAIYAGASGDGHDENDYVITDGERVSAAVRWNWRSGHLHNRLIAAMQQRCGFQPGEVRWCFATRNPSIGKPRVPVW